jgi:phosphoribosylaminoimidazolecarboxamide formyltransferase/IMP cyclohydrolase
LWPCYKKNDKWRVQRCLSLWPNISIWWCIDCKHKIVATAIEINKLFWSSYCSWIRCRSNWNFTTKEKQNYFNSKRSRLTTKQVRSCLNGLLIQERKISLTIKNLKTVTVTSPTEQEIQDLIFASKVCKTQNLTRSFCKTEH